MKLSTCGFRLKRLTPVSFACEFVYIIFTSKLHLPSSLHPEILANLEISNKFFILLLFTTMADIALCDCYC